MDSAAKTLDPVMLQCLLSMPGSVPWILPPTLDPVMLQCLLSMPGSVHRHACSWEVSIGIVLADMMPAHMRFTNKRFGSAVAQLSYRRIIMLLSQN
jgi:hypothetical protein